LQRATPLDLLEAQRFQQQEGQAMEACREQVERYGLPMKVVGAEYNYDGSRLTFFFASEQRVDFRDLVRELAHVFKTRIELRQIGVRDEARLLGGIGKCGRPLCCATWLGDFCPVSIKMAKQQDLPLSPMEISGLCGRLLCCLVYENDYYREVKGRFPRVGRKIDTPLGPGKVTRVSALRETVNVLLDDGTELELSAEQVAGEEPIEVPANGRGLGDAGQRALQQVVIRSGEGDVEEADAEEAPVGPRRRTPPAEPRAERPVEPDRPQHSGSRRRGRGDAAPVERQRGGGPRPDRPRNETDGAAPRGRAPADAQGEAGETAQGGGGAAERSRGGRSRRPRGAAPRPAAEGEGEAPRSDRPPRRRRPRPAPTPDKS
jgi:cell fate regulator YaaT (PSP1 superfamily)